MERLPRLNASWYHWKPSARRLFRPGSPPWTQREAVRGPWRTAELESAAHLRVLQLEDVSTVVCHHQRGVRAVLVAAQVEDLHAGEGAGHGNLFRANEDR